MIPTEVVEFLEASGFHLLMWKPVDTGKYPTAKNWTALPSRTSKDYNPNLQVGVMLGTEVQPGRFVVDIDVDWGDGIPIAMKLLPDTGFVFGHASKPVSHLFYLLPKPLPSYKYFDIDNSTSLLEIRGTEVDGSLGHQTMVPPSTWTSKDKTVKEPLVFRSIAGFKIGEMAFIESEETFRRRTMLTAIGMLLAKHFGKNGFGHDPRLAWSGFLLRAGISKEDLYLMGEGISIVCNNLEKEDVRVVVDSTDARLKDPKQKIKGGPALAKILGKDGNAVVDRINEWLGRDSDFVRNKNGVIIADSQTNIRRALTMLEVELSYDEFREKMRIQEHQLPPRVVTDPVVNGLWLRIDRDFHFRPTRTFFDSVVDDVARASGMHPVREYLDSLKWDGTPRIDRWLQMFGGSPDSEYHRAIAAIVLIAAVRRVRQPGCKYDEMLVLESEQGKGKSSTLRALCPCDDWFSDDLALNVDSKQIIEHTAGKWIIEASDLSGKRKTEVEQLKAMLSRQIDGPARMAYAHFPVERPRQFILIGTTNSQAYLTDSTGGRRFWPVRVVRMDTEGVRKFRDQLWAEAAHREARGESIRLPESLWDMAGQEQEKRREVDAWEEIIEEALRNIRPGPSGRVQISTEAIWTILEIEKPRRDRIGSLRISEIMNRFGMERTMVREDGNLVRGYRGNASMFTFEEDEDASE